jgi:hypothetical protein
MCKFWLETCAAVLNLPVTTKQMGLLLQISIEKVR